MEIILGQARRRWSEDEKPALVAETFVDFLCTKSSYSLITISIKTATEIEDEPSDVSNSAQS